MDKSKETSDCYRAYITEMDNDERAAFFSQFYRRVQIAEVSGLFSRMEMTGSSWCPEASINELEAFRSEGDLISTSKYFNVPVHHASDPVEYLGLIKQYRDLADQLGATILFRGQSRDYFNTDRKWTVYPASLRPNSPESPFSAVCSLPTAQTLVPWLDTLNDHCGLDFRECLTWIEMEDYGGLGCVRFLNPDTGQKDILSDNLAGILQHYGFPTFVLDVTVDPQIALFFALHKTIPSAAGLIDHEVVVPSPNSDHDHPQQQEDIPSVQIYLQSPDTVGHPIIDLMGIKSLTDVAARPLAQKAFCLPFRDISMFEDEGSSVYIDKKAYRNPSALIKLHFSYNELLGSPDTHLLDHFIPLDDKLYQALLKAQVPHMAIYQP